MDQFRSQFKKLRLNVKFTIVIILFVLLPILAFSLLLFRGMEENAVNRRLDAMAYRMEKSYDQIVKNIDAINMSSQFFLSDAGLRNHLKAVKNGQQIMPLELMDFYNENIILLERMLNNNPYLYQIRVYADSPDMQEMMPILYRTERMRRLKWAAKAGGGREDMEPGWKFDYYDTLFDAEAVNRNKKIMSLVMPVTDIKEGQIGIMEAAMYMETMFPVIYDPEQGTFGFFADEDGTVYFDDSMDSSNNADLDFYISDPDIKATWQNREEAVFYTRIKNRPVIVGIKPVAEMNGVLVCFDSMQAELGSVGRLRLMFIAVAMVIVVILIFIINLIVKGLLHQFYDILHSIREVQKGDLDVVITGCGTDEMGELGTQINTMLTRIKQLMADNVNREILARNSEIRALQNQINAHFIYNVLESIKMMAEIDEKYAISDAITALGKLLRYSMRWSDDYVSVADELDYIKNYLKLINLRFDYEIGLAVNVPEDIICQRVPKMSLQPIIENAIYHGLEQLAEDTSIYIKGLRDGDDCVIEITDMGKGMSEEEVSRLDFKINGTVETSGGAGNGIGLKNVQDRIQIGYGEEYGLRICSQLGLYTKIIIRIPVTVTLRGG